MTNKALRIRAVHRDNLVKLARFLASGVVPDRQFDMMCFAKSWRGSLIMAPERLDEARGSVGCAVGWAPVAGVAIQPEDGNWWDYGERVFGLRVLDFDWCFQGAWHRVDNSLAGAAKRILHLLLHGRPKKWEFGSWQEMHDCVALYNKQPLTEEAFQQAALDK